MLSWTRAALRLSHRHALAVAPRPALARPFSASLHRNLARPSPEAKPSRTREHADDPLERDSYHLASQVRRIVGQSKGDVAPALDLVRAAPIDAATVVVWNVLLNAILVTAANATAGPTHAQAVRKAYDVWMEMKRRGITPSARGYGTFFTGVAKRAKQVHEDARRGKKVEGWNAELRAKVDTVHKQWLAHCERVLAQGDSADLVAGSGLGGIDGAEVEAAMRDAQDGRADTVVDLSAVPTNQYLSFLSSSLSLATTVQIPAAGQAVSAAPSAGPALLRQVLQTFHAIPNFDDASSPFARLAKTGVSYSILLGALRTALQATCAPGAVQGDDAWQTPPQLLDTALSAWTDLVASPPAPESPSTSAAAALSPVIPTSLLSLFLVPASAVVPAPYFSRAIAAAQEAFGFVPPAELATLSPPHPADLLAPLCTPLDAPGLGVALRVVSASGKKDWVRGWWEQVRDYPARFGLDAAASDEVRGREEAEVVIRACGAASDVEGIEEILTYLLSPSLRISPLHRPDLSTFTLALSSLARTGTPAAVDASLRVWSLLLSTLDPAPAPAIKAHYASAADALIRCALSTRDRGQMWRAIKAVALPSEGTSAFAPGSGAFPPPPGAPPAKAGARALGTSLAQALSRVLAPAPAGSDGLAPGAVPRERRGELEVWSARVAQWVQEAAAAGDDVGEGRREGESEMAWRRRTVALKRRSPTRAGAGAATDAQDGAGDKPAHTERRRRWWSERQEEWAQVRAEREKTGDGRHVPREPPTGNRRERWEGGRREERAVRFGAGERREDRPDRPRFEGKREDRPDRPRFEGRREDRPDRPRFEGKREDRPDRPRFEGKREDRPDRPRFEGKREDRPDRPRFEGKREDRPDRPRFEGKREDRSDRPRFRERREERPDRTRSERREYKPDFDRPREGYGSSDEKGANAFADYCASALDDVSSLASGTASSRSTDSTASTYSRGISGFSPASTASSAVAAGSSRSVSDGTDSDTVSRSESTARGAATGSSRIDGGSSAAGGLKAGSALVAAAVGGVFAVLVL
ncbi:hypothetical protein JCM3770_001119 [Rhodotorula araucariae]